MGDLQWNIVPEEAYADRLELMRERIREIPAECAAWETYGEYFSETAEFLLYLTGLYEKEKAGLLKERTMEECRADQDVLYRSILPEHYETSYENPAYAVGCFGEENGRLLSFLRAEALGSISHAFAGRGFELTIFLELFVQVYNCFQQEEYAEAKRTVYWHFHDYSEVYTENRIREMLCPSERFYTDLIMKEDLTDLRYLYRFGLPVGDNELGIAAFLNAMPEEQIQAMADTYTEGYRIGFAVTGKDLAKKKTVQIRYPLGFERMIRAAVRNFEKMGLQPVFGRNISSTPVNRQFRFDHKEDPACYLDKAQVERELEVMRTVLEQHKEQAAQLAGPAVVEVFGEVPFAPQTKKEAAHYDGEQQKLSVYSRSMSAQIVNEYVPGEETSFTIIAYPLPEIGEKFAEIFAETVVINTLDYEKYQKMQQKIIDVLDQAHQVRIVGKGKNRTDLTVTVHPLSDPEKQTAFENCVADVNIPAGEVFTSPVLAGTDGVLHVSEVFLNGLKYVDLELHFKDGMVTSYRCGNYEDEEEGKKYVRDNVLMRHDTLPMGEFAIGTNTTAYRMARRYQIADRLPILIAEKTGPHFAVGDTCYSHAEDTPVYNPDGKEIIARDNEVSLFRKEDMSKAYFNCHTDITIPYDELGAITAVRGDGSRVDIIRDGLFRVEGAEDLNLPLTDK